MPWDHLPKVASITLSVRPAQAQTGVTYTMSAYSVSTLNLVDAPEPGEGLILVIALVAGALLLGPRISQRVVPRESV